MSYRSNDPERRIEELETEIAKVVRRPAKRGALAKALLNALGWRVGSVILLYGLLSAIDATHESIQTTAPHFAASVWVWKRGVALVTLAICLVRKKVAHTIRGMW
jgi:hypothetical protein